MAYVTTAPVLVPSPDLEKEANSPLEVTGFVFHAAFQDVGHREAAKCTYELPDCSIIQKRMPPLAIKAIKGLIKGDWEAVSM